MSNNDLNNRDSVSAIARNRDDAIKIAEELRSAGFRDSDISFVMTGNDTGPSHKEIGFGQLFA